MKNINFLASGYDIFNGNPHTTNAGVDPGFGGTIFAFTFDRKQTTGDGRWLVPDDMDIKPDSWCDLSFDSSHVTGSQSYMKSLEENVEVSFERFGAKFSASTDYKRISKITKSENRVFTTSKATCSVYSGSINPLTLPAPNDTFLKTVNDLPTAYNKDAYMNLLKHYGTHYLNRVKMGAVFGFDSEFTQENWISMLEADIEITVAASYSGFGVSGSANSLTKDQQRQVNEFNSRKSRTYIYSLGSAPPQDGRSVTWAQQSIEEPMPIQYSLVAISELFSSQFLPHISNVQQIKKNVITAMHAYCEELKSEGRVASCSEPGPDPEPPVMTNACRFCQHKCGGDFTEDSGGLAMDQNWPDWFLTYKKGCPDHSYGSNGGNNIRLCCQNERNQISTGSCRLCTQCGGSYNIMSGKIMNDQNWPTWINAFGDGCGGDPSQRAKTHDSIQFCCRNKQICRLCVTCGGGFRNEVGVMSRNQYWGTFFQEWDRECSGEMGSHNYKNLNGVKLCCETGSSNSQLFPGPFNITQQPL